LVRFSVIVLGKTYGFCPPRGMGYGLLLTYGLWYAIPCEPSWWMDFSMGYKGLWVIRSMGYERFDCILYTMARLNNEKIMPLRSDFTPGRGLWATWGTGTAAAGGSPSALGASHRRCCVIRGSRSPLVIPLHHWPLPAIVGARRRGQWLSTSLRAHLLK